MARTEKNIETSEEFIRKVLAKNFHQQVAQDELRTAAERLCDAIPSRRQQQAV